VDVFSSSENPAALSQLKNAAVAVNGERGYMLGELNKYCAVIGLPTQTGNFGLQACYFGFSNYNESKLGLLYARNLGSKVDVGVVFNYYGINISGYGTASAISFEVGTVLHLTERLHTGVKVSNPVGGRFGKTRGEKLSSVFEIGFGLDASEKFYTAAEIEKEENNPVNVSATLQYKFQQSLHIRAGIATSTSSVWIGFGFSLRSFRMDVATNYHPQLGITPGLLLLFNFNSKI
jgi:hypothetical protein